MILIADVFPKFRALKNVVRKVPKKQCFRGPFERQHKKWVQTLLQSEQRHLSHIC